MVSRSTADRQTAGQRLISGWQGWLDAERAHLPLWLPVALAAGIALWFALPWADWRHAALLAALALAAGAALAGWRAAMALAAMLALGLAAVEVRVALNDHPVLLQRQFVMLDGVVAETQPLPFGAQRLILQLAAGQRPGGVERLGLRIPAGQPAIVPGSRIRARALLSPPAGAAVPGGYDVGRRAWFDGMGASGVALGPVVVVAAPGGGGWLAALRSAIQARITSAVPGEAGTVAAAFVTGQQGAIAPATAQAMRDAGLAHLLSISGLHIAVVVGGTALVLRRLLALWPWLALRLPLPTLALAGGALAGLAYTLLAGAQVPTVRAVIVASIVVLGMMLGRQALSLRLVAAAAFAILLVRPEALLGASFQMSFAAVIGIIALYESAAGKWLSASHEDEAWWHWLARQAAALLATGLVAEAALAGIGLYHFGRSGLYGVLANLIAIPWTSLVAMPALMLALLGDALGLGWFWPLAGWALQRLIDLADVTAAMPGAVIITSAVPGPAFALAAAGGLWLALWRSKARWLGLAGVAAGVALALASPPPDLLVNGDGRQLALRLPDGRLAHARARMGGWLLDNMAEAMGSDAGEAVWLGVVPGARCSGDACVADVRRDGRRWRLFVTTSRYLVPRAAMEPACRAADIVVADRRLPRWCRPRWLKLDRTALAQTGAVAIWLDRGRVAVAADLAGDRPWRPAPDRWDLSPARARPSMMAGESTLGSVGEEAAMPQIIEPERPIIDPHHHLWDLRRTLAAAPADHDFRRAVALSPLYLLPELLADFGAGHNIVASVFVECGAYYRAGAPAALRPVGETEFVNGVAAMSASGLYGPTRACAGIVAHADLLLGTAVADVLAAHQAAAPERLRGVRHSVAHDPDPAVLGFLQSPRAGLLAEPAFRAGLAAVARAGLSYDVWLLAPQLPDLIAAAKAVPDLTIICDHVATPLGIGAYAGQRDDGFAAWGANIRALAACPNVVMKLGGLAMPFGGFEQFLADPMASAEALAQAWRPWIETCITAFGPGRCMFESNFPVDRGTCDYATLWNAFKLIAAGASEAEKTALFSGTAARVYRLAI